VKFRDIGFLVGLTIAAVIVHGYHPNAEDAAIYLPGVEKQIWPELFPFNQQFFASHARFSIFPQLIAWSVKITHLSLYQALFLWHLLSIVLLLWACFRLAALCTQNVSGRWAAVSLVAALLTLPVAGTALYIMDQYVNPRNLCAFAAVLAVVLLVEERYLLAGLCLFLGAAIHPFMSFFAFAFCAVYVLIEWRGAWRPAAASIIPLGFLYPTPTPAYHQVALSHPYHYLVHWQWYEVLGAVGPLCIFWILARFAAGRRRKELQRMSQAAMLVGAGSLLAALILALPSRFEVVARIQPLRSFYLLYVLLLVFLGTLLGEYLLKAQAWRWILAFLPMCIGMFVAQRSLFPESAHIELPGVQSRNPWVQAFEWTRDNTPLDARFALDPDHMRIAGEDANGFRAISRRSMLADAVKDSGAVSMFPPLADEWLRQVDAQTHWKNFQSEDFERLQAEYGVNWVILQQPMRAILECPYQNPAVAVCRLENRNAITQQIVH